MNLKKILSKSFFLAPIIAYNSNCIQDYPTDLLPLEEYNISSEIEKCSNGGIWEIKPGRYSEVIKLGNGLVKILGALQDTGKKEVNYNDLCQRSDSFEHNCDRQKIGICESFDLFVEELESRGLLKITGTKENKSISFGSRYYTSVGKQICSEKLPYDHFFPEPPILKPKEIKKQKKSYQT